MAIYQGSKKVANNYTIDNTVYCVPIGSIISYSSTNLPKGFLLCDGSEISKTEYSDLYNVIGDSFGTSTDNTKFKLPDLRDKFIQGANDNLGTSKEAGLPNITGEWIPGSVPDTHSQYTKGAIKGISGVEEAIASNVSPQIRGYGFALDASKSNSIYGNSTTVQPPAVCLYYIIKATKLSDIPVDVNGIIDDNNIATDTTYSSEKINNLIPTSLPANGGNADTLNNLTADTFLQNKGILTNVDLLDYILTMTDSGWFFASASVTNTPIEGQWFWIEVRRDENGNYCVTATRYNSNGVYINRYNNNSDMKKWYGWSNVASSAINDNATTSTTETWSAKKLTESLSDPFSSRIILSMNRTSGELTKTATLNSDNGIYLYWSSEAGQPNYSVGLIIYYLSGWHLVPLTESTDPTTITFTVSDKTLTMSRNSTPYPSAGGVIALGASL